MIPRIRNTRIGAGVGAVMLATGCAAIAAGELASKSANEVKPPFSGSANVAYAEALWDVLAEKQMVGADSIVTYPYEGQPPHGGVLEYLDTDVTLEGHTGFAMVKKNYRSDDLDPEELEHAILDDPRSHLASVTVMYRREAGYDPDHQNWFWAKYAPDGSLMTNPKGMALAGRVAKGKPKGCIACHQAAPGGDYIFTHDRLADG